MPVTVISWTPINGKRGSTRSVSPVSKLTGPKQSKRCRKQSSSSAPSLAELGHVMTTRSKSTNAARRAVFETHELMLLIFNQMSMIQLLCMRSVCKGWKNIIMTSKSTLRQLFLERMPTNRVWFYDFEQCTVKAWNHYSLSSTPTGQSEDWLSRQRETFPGMLNPLLFQKDMLHEHVRGVKNNVLTMMIWCDTTRFIRSPSLRSDVLESSLMQRMFICQPPCEEAEFRWQFHDQKPTRKPQATPLATKVLRISVENEEGVTFGDLVAAFLREARNFGLLGLDVDEQDKLWIKRAKSVVWIKKVCFPTEKEREEVELGLWDSVNGKKDGVE